MKKILIIITAFAVLFLFSACASSPDTENDGGNAPAENIGGEGINEGVNEGINEGITEGDITTNPQIGEADDTLETGELGITYAPLSASSVDELIASINAVKSGNIPLHIKDINVEEHNIAALEKLVVPNFTSEDYRLYLVCATKISITYYYIPATITDERVFIDRGRDIIVSIRRSEHVNQANPLQPLIEQLKIMPTEGKYLYDNSRGNITFAYEDVWIRVTVPEALSDYNTIKTFCKAKTVELD